MLLKPERNPQRRTLVKLPISRTKAATVRLLCCGIAAAVGGKKMADSFLAEVAALTARRRTVREIARAAGLSYDRTQRLLRRERPPRPEELAALRRAAIVLR